MPQAGSDIGELRCTAVVPQHNFELDLLALFLCSFPAFLNEKKSFFLLFLGAASGCGCWLWRCWRCWLLPAGWLVSHSQSVSGLWLRSQFLFSRWLFHHPKSQKPKTSCIANISQPAVAKEKNYHGFWKENN